MWIKNISIIALLGFLVGCNGGQNSKEETTEEPSLIEESWSSVKSGVQVPFEYFEERSRKADSAKKTAISQYYKILRKRYPEYSAAEKWFQSNPSELLGLQGNYYKITEGSIQNGKSISRSHFVEPSQGNRFLYFFRSEERYFILELEVNDQVICNSVRCIMEGWGEQPMFDYIYDEKGNLIEEVFQADVKPSFYEDDGNLYFEYADNDIKNTVSLGPTI